MFPKIQKDFLLLFRCIIDFGAEVVRDFTEEKIKITYNTEDFRTFLENTRHDFYHLFDKKKVACCECPATGCIQKTERMDQKIYSKLYVYDSSMKFPKGHFITNGSSTIQICICRYSARTLRLTDLDLSDLYAILIGLRSIKKPAISDSELGLVREMMSVRGDVCHAATTTTFLEPELINLWTKFTNALYNLCPGDQKYVKWLKKTIETTKKTILSEEELNEVMGTIRMLSTDVRNISEDLMNVMNDKTTDITNFVKTESTGIKTYFDNTLQPFTEQQTRYSELLLESEKTVCQTVSKTAQDISTCIEKEGIKNRGHSTELLQTLENNQKANFEKFAEKMIGHLDKLFVSHPVFASASLPAILTENVNENDACTHRKIKIQAKITQSSLTEENEEKIIQTLSPVIEIPNVESKQDNVQAQKMYVMAKKVNSIELELDVTAEILVNKETFRRAILTLVKTVIVAGEVQTKNADPIHAILTFDSPITEDEKATVKDLLTTPDRNGAQSKEETTKTTDDSYYAAMGNEDATMTCNGCKEKDKLIQQLINSAADKKGIELEDDANLLCEGCRIKNKRIRDMEYRSNKLQETIWKLDQIDQYLEDANLRMNPLYKSSECLEDAEDSAYKTGGTSDVDVFSDVHEVVSEYSEELKERENYLRFSIVTAEIINYAYQILIEMELKRRSISLEEFINLNQHEIQHMNNNESCCQCTGPVVIKATKFRAIYIQTAEMKMLFDDQKKRLPGHSDQTQNTYCCCYAKSGIKLNSLTTKIANILLVNFCTHNQEITIVAKELQEVVDAFYYTTTAANLTDVEYQKKYSSKAIGALTKIGMYCRKEDAINLKLQDVQRFIVYRKNLETLRLAKDIRFEVKDIKREEKDMEVTDESIDQQNLNVFLWHSKELKDLQIVTDIVVPRMEQLNVKIYPQDRIEARQLSTTSVTKLLNMTEKILIFISKNSLCSTWCSLELMTSVEQFQRINSCATILLLYDLLESEVPHLPVFDDAAIVHVSNDKDEWADKVMEALTGERCRIMKARNVATGLALSHFYGFQQYVLPRLESKVKKSDWYRTQSAEIQSKVSFKLYEVIPKSCRRKDDFKEVDRNIQFVTTIPITVDIRAGNHRHVLLMVYSITDGQETFYCMCETPSVISVFRKMEDHNLVRFEHIYEGTGEHSEASLKVDDCTLLLNRLCYAMKSIVNHFELCTGIARVVLFDDEKESISNVLFDAVKEELQHVELKMQYTKLKTRLLESDQLYQFEVCVASVEHNEDRTKKNQIINYLKANDIKNILDYDIIYPGLSLSQKLLKTSQKCRWLICLLTRNFMTDESLTLSCLSKLNDIICRKQVRVIIVRENDARAIPECLRWLTYVPFDERNHSHLKGLYSIISGNDSQMETQRMLSYGDVAYGLAWGYISNYLMEIIPGIFNGIDPAFREKGLDRYICPRKLYIVLPKSCKVVGDLTDKERIKFFSSTSSTYLFGNKRPFYCGIYKMTSTIASVVKNFYFVGQFAAPLYIFHEMRESVMYQLNSWTMEIETEAFYKILCDLMKNVLPEKAMFCEFVYFDDSKSSLADIMEQKIKQIPHDTSY